jgi:hypothetical protein
MCKCNPNIRSPLCNKCAPKDIADKTKIYTIQEIWGDGDSYPSLKNLKLFYEHDKAIAYCNQRFKQLKKEKPNKIYYDNLVITDFFEGKYPDFDVSYGCFSGFTIRDQGVE